MVEVGLQAEELFYPKSLSSWFDNFQTTPSYSSGLISRITLLLGSAHGFRGDDSSVLEPAVAAFRLAGSIDSEQNLEKVLDALEISLLKTRQKLSLGLVMSLCFVALLSYVCAGWTLQHRPLSEGRLDEQAFALKALCSLIRPSEVDEYLRYLQEEAGVRIVSGIWYSTWDKSSTC